MCLATCELCVAAWWMLVAGPREAGWAPPPPEGASQGQFSLSVHLNTSCAQSACALHVCVCVASLAHFLSSLSEHSQSVAKEKLTHQQQLISNPKYKKKKNLLSSIIITTCWKRSQPFYRSNKKTDHPVELLLKCWRLQSVHTAAGLFITCELFVLYLLALQRPVHVSYLSTPACLPADSIIVSFCLGLCWCLIPTWLVALSPCCYSTSEQKKQRADHKLVLLCKHAATLFFRISQSCEL